MSIQIFQTLLEYQQPQNSTAVLVRLMALYNLTQCKALCALQFIATPSIADIADGSNRSMETVRNHIKSIMQKLDVHNQGALMKKLLAIAAYSREWCTIFVERFGADCTRMMNFIPECVSAIGREK